MAEFAYNNKAHSGTKVSLFEANNGWNLRMGFELRKKREVQRSREVCKENGRSAK